MPDRVNILIVDDLPEKMVVYKSILEEMGQNLMTAQGGEEALKMVLAHEFAVILLDVNMPGLDGFETASLIRQRRKSAKTPIIFLTAFTDEQMVSQGYATGAVDYLTTPVIPEVLRAKVRVFIELSQMRRQAALQAEETALRKAAEESDRRKDEFLGMLAHELRNPLGPIRNAVQLMQMMGAMPSNVADARVAQLWSIVDRQVTHMARLIDDLLDSTRLARGQILLRREKCDLAKLVRQTVSDYGSLFETDGVALSLDIPDTPVWADCDSTRFSQMVGNLLHNAHKFTDPGGAVRVTVELQDGMARITVRDTGIGIDEGTLPYVFDTFRQGEQGLDRRRGGLGLGLALVRGLAALHGGEVQAFSDGAGKGASVMFTLPLAEAGLATGDEAQPALAKAPMRRILIIEDSADTAETMSQILTGDGHEVRIAATGSDGVSAAMDFRPEVILCDIGLPGLDGYQVVRAIRNAADGPRPFVVAMTGYGRVQDQKEAKKAGFDLHLVKPVDHGELRRILGKCA